MGNLDREIDLMLERSQRRYECLDQQIDLMLEGSLSEYIRAGNLDRSAKTDRSGAFGASSTETPQEDSPIVDSLKFLFGSEEDKILAAGKLLGKLLLAKEENPAAKIIGFIPSEKQVKSIIWLLDLWEKIPMTLKLKLAKDPRMGIAVMALNKHAENINKALRKSLDRTSDSVAAPDASVLSRWTGKLKDYVSDSSEDEEPEKKDSLPTFYKESLLKEDKLTTITIDFNELRKQELNESFLAMFGGWIEYILGAMFGGRSLPLSVKGSRREVESFAKAIGGEKKYVEVVRRYGLDHPTTYKNKAKLDNAIKGFEKETGLKWPFK